MHIQFKPGLRTLWRGAGTVQIGLSSERGTVLDGLVAADARVVEQLRSGIDPVSLDRSSPGRAARHRQLLSMLDDAGVLLVRRRTGAAAEPGRAGEVPGADRLNPDAALWSLIHPQSGDGWPVLAQRARQRVLIAGAGRLGATLASTLAAAGVGQIGIVDGGRVAPSDLTPAGAQRPDLGRPRQDAAADAVLRAGGRAITGDLTSDMMGPPVDRGADIVVLVDYGTADASAADNLVAGDVPHLSVVIREDDVVVGPMVRPGQGPCLRCLDLHRSDRDPAWPSIVAQLASRPQEGPGEESALAVLGAGLAALQVLAQLDGQRQPATVGATLEIEPPDGLVARRVWPAHRACGCHWPLRSADDRRAAGAAGEPNGENGARMNP